MSLCIYAFPSMYERDGPQDITYIIMQVIRRCVSVQHNIFCSIMSLRFYYDSADDCSSISGVWQPVQVWSRTFETVPWSSSLFGELALGRCVLGFSNTTHLWTRCSDKSPISCSHGKSSIACTLRPFVGRSNSWCRSSARNCITCCRTPVFCLFDFSLNIPI